MVYSQETCAIDTTDCDVLRLGRGNHIRTQKIQDGAERLCSNSPMRQSMLRQELFELDLSEHSRRSGR